MHQTHLVTESVDWDTKCPCQPEITNLQLSTSVYEQILRFQIPMQHSIVMTKGNALNRLI